MEEFDRPHHPAGLPAAPPHEDDDRLAALRDIIGTTPASKYLRVKSLGSGSFGSAWQVEESSTKAIYAAKVMDTNNMSAKDRGFVTNEVRCLERCHHPNIVRHQCHYERDGLILIIMEFADGGDLYRQIKARQPLARHFRETEINFILLQLCLALHHIHSKKMMHRDLKTANVMLTTTGLVKLGDFGFSRQYEDSLSNPVGNTFCGTPYYLSPELWRRAPYSNKSEMWALGVVLFEAMALRRPFTGRNMDELIDSILRGRRQPFPPSARYSQDLIHIVDCLLSVDAAARPSVRQLLKFPFLVSGLETLRSSISDASHNIPAAVREQMVQDIDEVMNMRSDDPETLRVTPREGRVQLFVDGQGWRPCDLALSATEVSLVVDGGTNVVIELANLTSVCPIDPSIANENFVLALKSHTGKSFWLREKDNEGLEGWLKALQCAMPY